MGAPPTSRADVPFISFPRPPTVLDRAPCLWLAITNMLAHRPQQPARPRWALLELERSFAWRRGFRFIRSLVRPQAALVFGLVLVDIIVPHSSTWAQL